MVTIELLSPENFPVGALDAYERKQQVQRVYRKTGTGYALVEHPYTEDWTSEQKRSVEGVLRGKRHLTYLALDNGRVAGFISLKRIPVNGFLIVDQMQVSAPYRGQGIGRRLFEMGIAEAKKAGVQGLYISACSSEETIAFYRAMGAELTDVPIRELAEAEPFDLQMICRIGETAFPC